MNPLNRGPIRKFNAWFDGMKEPYRFFFFIFIIIMGWMFIPAAYSVVLQVVLISWFIIVGILAISRLPL